MEANRTLSRAFRLLASNVFFSRHTQCQSGRGEYCRQAPERKDLIYLQFAHACLMRLIPCADSKEMSIAEIITRDRDGIEKRWKLHKLVRRRKCGERRDVRKSAAPRSLVSSPEIESILSGLGSNFESQENSLSD